MLPMILFTIRNDRFCFTKLVEHDHQLAALDLLHLPGEEVADPASELVTDARSLAFANALHDPLLRSLNGGAAEFIEVDLDFHHVPDLELGVHEPRLFKRDFTGSVGHLFHYRFEQHDADGAFFLVDLDFCLHVGPVLLSQSGMNAVLEKPVQLLARDLLQIRQFTECCENLR